MGRISFSPLAEIIMIILIAMILLLGVNLAHGAKPSQCPKPPQAPPMRVFNKVVVADKVVRPTPIQSPCSSKCVCGCNQGGVCECGSIPATTQQSIIHQPIIGSYSFAQPQYQHQYQTVYQPSYQSFVPSYNSPMVIHPYFSQGSITYSSGCPGGVCR